MVNLWFSWPLGFFQHQNFGVSTPSCHRAEWLQFNFSPSTRLKVSVFNQDVVLLLFPSRREKLKGCSICTAYLYRDEVVIQSLSLVKCLCALGSGPLLSPCHFPFSSATDMNPPLERPLSTSVDKLVSVVTGWEKLVQLSLITK